MGTISGRRQKVHQELELTSDKDVQRMEKSAAKEEARMERKLQRQLEIEESSSYKMISGIATAMDKYFLDPILGLIPGLGDMIGTVCAVPFIYVSLFKVRSISLTLAVIYYNLLDMLIGLLPFWIGNISDFFYRANLKNFKLIQGFVEEDKDVIEEVNRRAVFMGIMIGVLCLLIYWLVGLVISISNSVWEWISGLFS